MNSRITSYIYKYSNNKKNESKGYIKYDRRDKEIRITISLKDNVKDMKYDMYAVSDKNRKHMGEVEMINGTVNKRFSCDLDLEKLTGMIFCDAGKNIVYGSTINDGELESLDVEQEIIEEKIKKEDEVADIKEYDELPKNDEWKELIFTKFPKVIVRFDGEDCEGIKMRPHDFVWFPQEYWEFSSNQYLLKAYYDYRYILFVKGKGNRNGRYYICVPGKIYENYKATNQGFEEFVSGEIGFWCHKV